MGDLTNVFAGAVLTVIGHGDPTLVGNEDAILQVSSETYQSITSGEISRTDALDSVSNLMSEQGYNKIDVNGDGQFTASFVPGTDSFLTFEHKVACVEDAAKTGDLDSIKECEKPVSGMGKGITLTNNL